VNSLIRRKLLGVLGSSVTAGTALLMIRPGRAGQRVNVEAVEASGPALFPVRSALPPSGEAGEDPLLPEARQWVDRLRGRGTTKLMYPVSRLQREFRIGYTRTCALADCLAQHGEWTIAYDENGTRYARIHRMA
jgi:hypothetical protein